MNQTPPHPQTVSFLFKDSAFRHVRNHLSYDDMHVIRDDIAAFLTERLVREEDIGMILLAVTEVLSNIIKHPAVKPTHIEIHATINDARIHMDVMDDSTSFSHFNAKCEEARKTQSAAVSGAESGYGLGCILKIAQKVSYTPLSKSDDGLNHFKIDCNVELEGMERAEKREKIFLIDDDPIALQIQKRMLENVYRVFPFDSAKEALRLFPLEKPDLVISDITMPEMDGIELRKALSRLKNGDETPFIFLSGLKDQSNSLYISSLGIDDFLCKPVSAEKLLAVVGRLIRRSAQVKNHLQGKYHHDISHLLSPSLPHASCGWTFSVRHAESETGGGDFILHEETAGGLSVVISDVMGHGLSAKFFSYAYGGYIRSLMRLYRDIAMPALLLQKLSDLVTGDSFLENVILTCQAFHFFRDGRLSVASAGHPPPLLLREKDVSTIEAFGPLPGLIDGAHYIEKSIPLQKGDRVVFMSDGFLEGFGRQGDAVQKIIAAVQAHNDKATLSQYLFDECRTHQTLDVWQKDDVTLVIATYEGTS